jgi:hypothetical protein
LIGAGCGVAAALTTLVVWSIVRPDFVQNSLDDYLAFYRPVAQSVLDGRGLTTKSGELALRYPPGYPLLIAGVIAVGASVGLSENVAIAGLILVGTALNIGLVYLLASLVWDRWRSLVAAAVALLYPITMWLTLQPYSEVPTLTLLLGGLYCCVSPFAHRRVGYSVCTFGGLLIGCSALVRPANIAVLLPIILLLLLWTAMAWRFRVLGCVAMVAGYMCVVAPWELYVYQRTHVVIPLSTGGPPSIVDGLTYGVNSWKSYRKAMRLPADVEQLQRDIYDRQAMLVNVGEIGRLIAQEVAKRPVAVLKLYTLKAMRSWYATDVGNSDIIVLGIQVPYLLLAVAGSVVAWRRQHQRDVVITVWTLVAYFWVMTTIVLSICRYMVPASVLLALLVPALVPAQFLQFVWTRLTGLGHLLPQSKALKEQ